MAFTRCDLALALAPFRRRPGAAAVALILLAAACALTTVNFSTFLFLHTRPLPYPNYERLVFLGQAGKVQRGAAGDNQTLDNFLFLQAELKSTERIAAFNKWRNETLRHGDVTETVTGCWITPGLFELLGVKAVVGTTFSDPAAIGRSPRPLVLSDGLWARRFDRNPGVVGQTVWLNDRPHVVIGVMGGDFEMPSYAREDQPEYWAPLDPKEIPKAEWKSRWYPTLALRGPGVSTAQMQAELDLATPRLRELYPAVMAERELVAHDLKQWLLGANRRYFNLLIMTAALLSGLIVVNLVNLLIGQLADRGAYFATAQALGADRRQLLRPLLAEHGILSVIGLVTAVPLALAYRHLLITALGPAGLVLPRFETGVFFTVGCGAVLLVLGTVVLGVRVLHREQRNVPGVASARIVASRSHGWIDGAAVLGQTALAITLLVVCSLLALSLRRQASANAGLPLVDLQKAFLVMRPEKYPDEAARIRRLLEVKTALAAWPEISGAALANPAVPSENNPLYGIIDDLDSGQVKDSDKFVIRPAACPDYFALAGLRLVAGRVFTEQDLQSGRRLMVVSRRAAELYWPGRDPIGRRVLVNHRSDDWAEVIGVVENIDSPKTNETLPLVWRSIGHHPYLVTDLVFQTRTGAPVSRERFEKFLRGIDPDILIGGYGSVADALKHERRMPEAIAQLSLLLAVVAAVVCAFGIFSILNRRVASSLPEIAVRKALGASAWHIVTGVGRRDLAWATGGLVIGLGLALMGGRHVFEVGNLRGAELVLAPVAASGGVLVAALLGALVPLVRALAADTLPLLREQR